MYLASALLSVISTTVFTVYDLASLVFTICLSFWICLPDWTGLNHHLMTLSLCLPIKYCAWILLGLQSLPHYSNCCFLVLNVALNLVTATLCLTVFDFISPSHDHHNAHIQTTDIPTLVQTLQRCESHQYPTTK